MSKKQQMRFNDVELGMIKNTFSGNEALLLAVRKVFLQFELSKADKDILSVFKGKKELMDLIHKVFNPKLDADAPLHQLIDLWMSVDLKDKSASEYGSIFAARKMLIDLLSQQLSVLEAVSEGKKISVGLNIKDLTEIEGKSAEEFYVALTARNTLITHVDMMLAQLEVLAGQSDETVEQTRERLIKDSAK